MEHVLCLKNRQLLKDLVDCRIGIRSSGLSEKLYIDWSSVASQLLTSMSLVLYHPLALGPALTHFMLVRQNSEMLWTLI